MCPLTSRRFANKSFLFLKVPDSPYKIILKRLIKIPRIFFIINANSRYHYIIKTQTLFY